MNKPVYGSFPLDRDNVCRDFVRDYVKCVRRGGECVDEMRLYFDCRLRHGLLRVDEAPMFLGKGGIDR